MTSPFPPEWPKLNVILSHDWLTGMRGGERVLETLCRGFPEASIYTLIHNAQAISDTIKAHPIQTSWLQHVPGIFQHYRYLLPLFPAAMAGMKPPCADLLISTSHCVAKGLRVPDNTRHLCYCFTPMRYAWTFYDEYFGTNPVKALLAKPLLSALRAWDKKASPKVDHFVAISRHVRERIRNFYGRDADVVYPPVDTEKWTPAEKEEKGDFDLIVSALVPYKRIDLAVRAYSQTGYPLKIVGIGGDLDKLRAIAAPNVEFLRWQSDEQILKLYRSCRLLLFPGEEDFGIVPLEAQACGKPVVAFKKGGALETIQDGVSGLFFAEQTEQSLLDAVNRSLKIRWDKAAIRANAEKFDVHNFLTGMNQSIQTCLKTSPAGKVA